MISRYGRKEALSSFIKPAIFYLSIATLLVYMFNSALHELKGGILVGVALLGIWRYGLLIINVVRTAIYASYTYPNYLKTIDKIAFKDRFPKTIYFVIPSYKEDAWVTTEVFKSLITELNTLPCEAIISISTSSEEEDSVIMNVFNAHPNTDNIHLIFQKQSLGKRVAMGHSLRILAKQYHKKSEDKNSVTIFMDGDTYIPKDTLVKSLPFFKLDANLGAVTTNETGYIESKSQWYKDWFTLKFAQRHFLFQSHSLSKRVLTLTGRFSLFRTDVVMREDFISLIENDIIVDPNFGKFRFLMGDDKSSWYYMMKHGYNLLYLPDVLAYSLESRDGAFLEISRTLPYRWYGNTLRNNKRARQLKNQPLFIKYLFYDQLALMWTSLVGVIAAIMLSLFKSIFYLPLYIAWIFYVRVFQMGIFSFLGHRVSMRTLPLLLYGQWYGAYVKIRSFFNLTDQKWSKAGGEVQTADNDTAPIQYKIAKYFSAYRMYLFVFIFLFIILTVQTHLLKIPDYELIDSEKRVNIIVDCPCIPNDNKDDSLQLNRLIKDVPDKSIIRLPKGTLDIDNPIIINRSNISIIGNGTLLVSHFKDSTAGIITITGKRGNYIGYTLTSMYDNVKIDVKLEEKIGKKELFLIKGKMGQTDVIKVASYEGNTILMQFLSKSLIKKKADIYKIFPVKNVTIKNIAIKSENQLAIDGLFMQYASSITLEKINIVGLHPLRYEYLYNCYKDGVKLIKETR